MTDARARGRILAGIPVVAGVAYGPVLRVAAGVPPEAVERLGREPLPVVEALGRYDAAVTTVAQRLQARAAAAAGAAAEVLTATAGLARDPGLRAAVQQRLEAGDGLPAAVRGSVEQFAALFARIGGRMAERVTDMRDLERRLTAEIVGEPEPGVPVPDRPSVLVADDLTPADTAGLDAQRVLAIVTERGGPTSHTAIIARQLGIPCVVAVGGALDLATGSWVLVDGGTGAVEEDPDQEAATVRVRESARRLAGVAAWTGPARTADGTPVKLLANVADVASAVEAAGAPVEGSGLFRTELCFLDRRDEPSVEEQAALYAAVLEAFGPERTVVVRTLDAGSDKPIGFAALAREENPALGVRGLRLSFGNPGLLTRQLDAVALAAERSGTQPWVMAPMVATVTEARDFAARVRDRGLRGGVMVEVPAAALLAHRILEHVDFLSIGSNDLTQYTMAADRTAGDLARLTDPWQPAVLSLVAMTARAGRDAGKPVGVCGEAAADPLLAAALVGIGVTSLSMPAAAVRPVGATLAGISLGGCEAAAEAALAAGDPAAARDAVRRVLA